MTQEQKTQIIAAATAYCKEKQLGINELAKISGINAGYMSTMMRSHFHTVVGEKEVAISDKWFIRLAQVVGHSIDKPYWETVPTRQMVEIVSALEACKASGKTGMLIGNTGFGKTYIIDRFVNKHPLHTYRITVSSLYKLDDILNELMEKIGGMEHSHNRNVRLRKIMERLRDIRMAGGNPIIILDEAENLEIGPLKMLKALFDGVKDDCSIVMIGTEQLMNKLLNLRKRNRDAIPQLYRRFKAGYRPISPIEKHKDFLPFFEKYVEEKGLRKLLLDLCENYGELNDYLEPALREADRRGEPLTENLFRIIYNMPKY